MHHLAFCEPSTQNPNDPSEIFVTNNKFFVNDNMYKLISNGPKIIYQDNEPVGYVFGPLYDRNQYSFLGEHGNDVAQTGIYDMDIYDSNKDHGKIIDRYYHNNYDWNDRTILKRIQREILELLWLGETFGGDVGAEYYAHFNNQNVIDSLVVNISWITE